ncbi:class I SAM-dependent methyltransferase [Ureibacillus sp. FSL K6-8385]|uniref:Class I SAM-dependent methyltransferase n=1 Tax=Ureibacillus terrenus TaxID=118246 RepID=A0A540V2V7_9BACL|nr:class I SAM-dependent methyltransferase [Ureibacillus terrenus]MED3662089.1 class I SAM-dependent methyltransferase [Ureibacillus terrenus]MED3763593.1 class I SAM-dependent methyltransferase [Ureibacillus terrenus]TQE91079.1 class I SAM-dependent methyltransferase [Ureibacillus terrenus]
MTEKAKYRTWIRVYKLVIFIGMALILLDALFLPIELYLKVVAVILALPFLYISFLLLYSIYQFSPIGGNYQSRIHDFIVSKVDWDGKGKALDIGAGNGSLIIKLAKAFPEGAFTGIDFWGRGWGYSKEQCKRNAEVEGVSNRVKFLKASAADLPFEDGEFDLVVSCLTFHEVKDSKNKTEVVKEALRVLKPGGNFVFLDLFGDEKIFGDEQAFLEEIRAQASNLESCKLADAVQLPKLLLHKKVLGHARILKGKK